MNLNQLKNFLTYCEGVYDVESEHFYPQGLDNEEILKLTELAKMLVSAIEIINNCSAWHPQTTQSSDAINKLLDKLDRNDTPSSLL